MGVHGCVCAAQFPIAEGVTRVRLIWSARVLNVRKAIVRAADLSVTPTTVQNVLMVLLEIGAARSVRKYVFGTLLVVTSTRAMIAGRRMAHVESVWEIIN
eukprot:gnl/MRDRNA2_/MRDRNA2_255832_c0_seq1.p2 gnl/MRDRNA2_/MRDRNA2_255832_c0~~gnl/MRDRNA2_/MRDRNA2_255832_c0_seq1.p2  ORF type:complete len:100 (+),score=4.45 gnl/MRDRNA2_/MRDRNA2_255832_c0_seq1:144-443(+)